MSPKKKQAKKVDCYPKLPEKGLTASYQEEYLLIKPKKARIDAESVIAPVFAIVVKAMLKTAAAERVGRVS